MRYPTEDEIRDARMEERDEQYPPDTQCPECGYEWWGDWDSGTRLEPPEPRNADCPWCGA